MKLFKRTVSGLVCIAALMTLAGACSSSVNSVDNTSCPPTSSCSNPTCPAGCAPGAYGTGPIGTMGMFSYVYECDPTDPVEPADCPVCASC